MTFLILLVGCQTWVPVDGDFKAPADNYKVTLPKGWVRFNDISGTQLETKTTLFITKRKPTLEFISISRVSTEYELPNARRTFSKGMLQEEAAELIIQDIHSNQQMMNQQIIENLPARLSERDGFKIVYKYQTKNGLKKEGIIYGMILDEWCYRLKYEAAERYYFSQELPTFAKVKDSFQLIKQPQ